MRHLIAILSSFIFIFCCGSCKRSAQNSFQSDHREELIDASTLDPAEIAAYDRAESEPFQGMSLKDCDILTVTKSNDSIPTTDILESDILYARYSQHACGDCISFLNSALIEYHTSFPTARIRLLLKDVGMRDLHVLENKLGKHFEVFKTDELPTDFDDAETPYLFKLDNDMSIRDFYIPRKELPDSLHAYLYN